MINNRELSWLSFNERVLQEAKDQSVPLLQRMRFLGIFSNNQDEFLKVRVANLIRMASIKEFKKVKLTGGYIAEDLLELVNEKLAVLQQEFTNTYDEILLELQGHGIFVVNEYELNSEQKEFCRNYYSEIIAPRLVPILIKKSTKLPFFKDGNTYLAVQMIKGKTSNIAIAEIPVSSACPRFVVLPSQTGRKDIIFIDDIIRLCLDDIFFMFNYDSITAHAFKILRDAQLNIDDDVSKSYVEKIEKSIEFRQHGTPIRLIYDKDMPKDVLDIISAKFGFKTNQFVNGTGRYHLMKDLMNFPRVDPTLESKNPKPINSSRVKHNSSILESIREKDILLNYPYHTFHHFIQFLSEAAIDQKVESIFITLYRTAERSKVLNALINAAKNGKKVTVLIELMARFDEEQNMESVALLQKEGVKILLGIEGVKVHSKLVLVERRERSQTRGYVYVGTGNFNEKTAQIYSDFGLFTANPQVAEDARAVFDFLENTHRKFTCKQLVVSPYFMRSRFERDIAKEIELAKKGKKAYIYAKFNSLTDEKMIKLLYKASRAGVKIKLIIRGACCLVPQLKGVSYNIEVISIVDKYLEHARMVIFGNGGDEKTYILSADWMTRNLDRRVEVGIPILDKSIQKTLKDVFKIQWSDNVKARVTDINGVNSYVQDGSDLKIRSQVELYNYYLENNQ
jgi:polyphosphate kinase